MSAIEHAPDKAVKIEYLSNGAIRYYRQESPSQFPGQTRGAAYVMEYNPFTGSVRSWLESYNHFGDVTRVHIKMSNGQIIDSPHFPPTGKELNLESTPNHYRSSL